MLEICFTEIEIPHDLGSQTNAYETLTMFMKAQFRIKSKWTAIFTIQYAH